VAPLVFKISVEAVRPSEGSTPSLLRQTSLTLGVERHALWLASQTRLGKPEWIDTAGDARENSSHEDTRMTRRELLLTIAICTNACRTAPQSATVTLAVAGMI